MLGFVIAYTIDNPPPQKNTKQNKTKQKQKQKQKQANKQTNKQTPHQTNKQTNTPSDKQTNKHPIKTNKQTNKNTNKQANKQSKINIIISNDNNSKNNNNLLWSHEIDENLASGDKQLYYDHHSLILGVKLMIIANLFFVFSKMGEIISKIKFCLHEDRDSILFSLVLFFYTNHVKCTCTCTLCWL